MNNTVSATVKRVETLAAKSNSIDDKKSRQVAALERTLEDQKTLAHDLRTDLKILRAKVHALEKRPQSQEVEVRHFHQHR